MSEFKQNTNVRNEYVENSTSEINSGIYKSYRSELMIYCPDISNLTKGEIANILIYNGFAIVRNGINIIERQNGCRCARITIQPLNDKGFDFYDKLVNDEVTLYLYFTDGDEELAVQKNKSKEEINNYKATRKFLDENSR